MIGKINICLIGAGRAGMIHAVNFRRSVPGADLVAVADPNTEACKEACKTLDIDRYYSDYKIALEQKDIDAVVIVAPTSLHCEMVKNAAAAGKHVFCEKPMAMNETECDEMINACNQAGVILQIGFMRRFDSSFESAYEAVQQGKIGDVVMIRSNTRGPSIPMPWTYDLKKSNGPLAEVNSHDIDSLRWFAGSEFESLYAIAGNYRCPDARDDYPDYYDNVSLIGRFENKAQGMIDGAVSVKYGYDSRMEVLGTHGCIYIGEMKDKRITIVEGGSVIQPVQQTWRTLYSEAYLKEDLHFVDCIRSEKSPRVTGIDGKMCVKVVNAGNLSISKNEIIRLSE
jgi:myo-inositol 2-dehydrogenase/D-chiro-inositol 1-dehydrogenase/scyllo-inositol 2-dehydrogenase (NAD+)